MGALCGPDFPPAMGLAVSGGGDSMAMLHLAAGWARRMGIALDVATVDHGLRPEAAAECALVADEAAGLGLPHSVLRWTWDGQGNLMDAARRARLHLIGEWAGGRPVAFAHTADDVAETFLMRLARGSGVEGLSRMAARRDHGGWVQLRPMLDITRAEIRHFLNVLKIPYVDDPTNEDPSFDRARLRRLMPVLAEEGIDVATLCATAARQDRARTALGARARSVLAEVTPPQTPEEAALTEGEVLFDRDRFAPVESDTQLRLLAAALQYVARADYRPRHAALEDVLDRALGGGSSTLHGCRVLVSGRLIRVVREYAAVEGRRAVVGDGSLWDRRWRLSGPEIQGFEVRALGPDGLAQLRDADRRGLPAAALHPRPAVWNGDRLFAFRDLCYGPGYRADFSGGSSPGGHTLDAWLLSH